MFSHEKYMSSKDIYHYIVYIYLVCLYRLDGVTLRKCIIQDPSPNNHLSVLVGKQCYCLLILKMIVFHWT